MKVDNRVTPFATFFRNQTSAIAIPMHFEALISKITFIFPNFQNLLGRKTIENLEKYDFCTFRSTVPINYFSN